MEKLEMLAKTFAGLEDVLKDELIEIGASDVEVVNRGVKFTGSKEILYKSNFCCRTALRILRIVRTCHVKNAQELYDEVLSIDWTEFFDISKSFAVNSTVYSEAFNNSMFVSLKTKDAIVDQFRSKLGKRPSENTEEPDIRINVHVSEEDVSISLDSSGESLHKRGYRVQQNEAPMSEVLAAGILKLAGWKGQTDLYDPMCGSGTIAIEAALIARNIQPGIFRKSFAFENWKDFDSDLFDEIFNADYEVPFENQVYGSDINAGCIRMSNENARSAGLKSGIQFETKDLATLLPNEKKGIVIMNPPYGERMADRQVVPLYNMIGTALKTNFTGFKVWIISSSEDGFRSIGLRPDKKIELYNGSLECELRCYDLYEGSKKISKQNNDRNYGDRENHRGEFGRDRERRFDNQEARQSRFEDDSERKFENSDDLGEGFEGEREHKFSSHDDRRSNFGGDRERKFGDRGDRRSNFGGARERKFSDRGDRRSNFGGDHERKFGDRGDRRDNFGGDRERKFGDRGDRRDNFGGDRERKFGDRGDRRRNFGGDHERKFGDRGDRKDNFGGNRERKFDENRSFDKKKEPEQRYSIREQRFPNLQGNSED